MHLFLFESSIPLFDLWPDHSSVPTKLRKVAARSGGQGRPAGRRECASSLTAASTAARCRSARIMLSAVVALAIATSAIVREASCAPLSVTQELSSVGDHLDGFTAEASERFAIPAAWIRAIMRVQCGGDARIAPRRGAIGLVQLMPETWAELRTRYALGDDPLDPRDNVLAGAAHLREMYDRYGSKRFLATYIMGSTRYDEHLKTGAPLRPEKRAYVDALARLIEPGLKDVVGSTARSNVTSWRKAPLFVAQTERGSSDKSLAPTVPAGRSSKFQTSADLSALAPRSDGLFARRGWRHDCNE